MLVGVVGGGVVGCGDWCYWCVCDVGCVVFVVVGVVV